MVVAAGENAWRLSVPAGQAGIYRLAQLDDYSMLQRINFPWKAPLCLELDARVSHCDIPGTWGFGFWNDPFNSSFGLGGMGMRLPAIPDAAWFFFASPQNYLSFQDDLPAKGFLAVVFNAAKVPGFFFVPAALAVPFLVLPPIARMARRMVRSLVREDSCELPVDPVNWHTYKLILHYSGNLPSKNSENPPMKLRTGTQFYVDKKLVFETSIMPQGKLGLVIWIDNQYAAFPPSGKLSTGTLASDKPAWLEISNINIG